MDLWEVVAQAIIWTVIIAASWGLYYVTRAVITARADKAVILRKKRNGARLISINGRILQERLAVGTMLCFLLSGVAAELAPLGWTRGIIAPFLVIGIILTVLKSYYRSKYRRKAIDYLDGTLPVEVPPEIPVEVAEHIDEAGRVDRLPSLEGGK